MRIPIRGSRFRLRKPVLLNVTLNVHRRPPRRALPLWKTEYPKIRFSNAPTEIFKNTCSRRASKSDVATTLSISLVCVQSVRS
jgi:hypothetical protein